MAAKKIIDPALQSIYILEMLAPEIILILKEANNTLPSKEDVEILCNAICKASQHITQLSNNERATIQLMQWSKIMDNVNEFFLLNKLLMPNQLVECMGKLKVALQHSNN